MAGYARIFFPAARALWVQTRAVCVKYEKQSACCSFLLYFHTTRVRFAIPESRFIQEKGTSEYLIPEAGDQPSRLALRVVTSFGDLVVRGL